MKQNMDNNSVTFKIYVKNNGTTCIEKCDEKNENICIREYNFLLTDKIVDIKKRILEELFTGDYNDIILDNITERVYRDFGKLHFEKGIQPPTINNYTLNQMTNPGRTFSFMVTPRKIVLPDIVDKKTEKKDGPSILKKLINEERVKNNDMCLDDFDAFPPLK